MKRYKSKENILLVFCGAFAGIINGVFGTGAGLILVPILKRITSLKNRKIHATTLTCVLFMCVSSFVVYLVKKQVDFELSLWCILGSVIGAIIGAILLQKLKNSAIDLIFSCLLILSGFVMICL